MLHCVQELQLWEIHQSSKTFREFVQVMHIDRYSFPSIQRFLTAGRTLDHYLLHLNKDIFLNTNGNSWEISQNLLKAMESNSKTPIVFNRSSSWKEKKLVALLSASHQIPINFV